MKNRSLFWVLVTAIIVRFAYFTQHIASPFFARAVLDQKYYDLCARQLAGLGGSVIDGFRPLLYPLFLSTFYRLDSEGGMVIALLVQHLLGIGMVVMVGWLASRWFGSTKVGIVTGLFFALSGPPLYFEGELLITTFFSFLLLLLWVVITIALKSDTIKRSGGLWILAGIILGLAAQARPNALPLFLLFPLLVGIQLKRKIELSKKRSFLPLLALGSLLFVQVGFGFFNAKYSGQFSLLTQAGGINFYLGNSKKADGMIPKQDRHIVYSGGYRDPIQMMANQGYEEATGEKASPKTVSIFWKEKTINEIKSNPKRWITLMIKKSWLMLWNHEVPNNRSFEFAAKEETSLLRWLPVRWFLLLALLPWGIAALTQQKEDALLAWSLSFFLLFSATIILFFVNSRFRIPLWPGMAILAGGGAIYLWNQIKQRTFLWKPILGSFVLLPLSLFNWFHISADPIENDLSMRANAYCEQARYNEALEDIQRCIRMTQNNPRYYFIEGNVFLGLKSPTNAISSYGKALALNPHDPMFYNNLGIAFEDVGDIKNALLAYHKALLLRPHFRVAKTNLLLLFVQTNQFEKANRLIRTFQKNEQGSQFQCAVLILNYKQTKNIQWLQKAKLISSKLAEQLLCLQKK